MRIDLDLDLDLDLALRSLTRTRTRSFARPLDRADVCDLLRPVCQHRGHRRPVSPERLRQDLRTALHPDKTQDGIDRQDVDSVPLPRRHALLEGPRRDLITSKCSLSHERAHVCK